MSDTDLIATRPAAQPEERDNLTRLLNRGKRKRPRINRRYSFFVRGMRLLLPMVALAIVAVVMAWPRMDETIAPIPKNKIIPHETGRNELINPHFESVNGSQQPYIITAERAVQSAKDQTLVMLDKPVADITMKAGEILTAKSTRGAYRQEAETLILDGDVILQHSSGYTMASERLSVSMKGQNAWTDRPVNGQGPSGTISAAGMKADSKSGVVTFIGPVKLTLTENSKGKSK